MARKTMRSSVYWRTQGRLAARHGRVRDIGGEREALRPKGDSLATTDPAIAERLVHGFTST